VALTQVTYPSFTPDGSLGTSFGAASSSVLLPGSTVSSDTIVLVVNLGPLPVALALGTSSAVVATNNGSLVVMPGQQFFFTHGSTQTYIAGIAIGALTGQQTIVNISTGN
jgi:hypothetical protein